MKRTIFVFLFLCLFMIPMPARANLLGGFVFSLSVSGKSNNSDVLVNPGVKPIQGTVNDKTVGEVLKGTLDDFAGDFLPIDPAGDGRFFLFFDSRTSWRVGPNKNGTNAITLTGQTDSVGNFIMFGEWNFANQGFTPPMLQVCAFGKVTFTKGTYNPTKITGTVLGMSSVHGEMLNLKFKTLSLVN